VAPGGKAECFLLPIADLLNHSPDRARWLRPRLRNADHTGGWGMAQLAPVAAGEEVFNNYVVSAVPVLRMLLTYGFAAAGHAMDHSFVIGMGEGGALATHAMRLVQVALAEEGRSDGAKVTLPLEPGAKAEVTLTLVQEEGWGLPRGSLALIRLLALGREGGGEVLLGLARFAEGGIGSAAEALAFFGTAGVRVSDANEAAALEILGHALAHARAQEPATLLEGVTMLARGSDQHGRVLTARERAYARHGVVRHQLFAMVQGAQAAGLRCQGEGKSGAACESASLSAAAAERAAQAAMGAAAAAKFSSSGTASQGSKTKRGQGQDRPPETFSAPVLVKVGQR
jgi:hypothetical protein